MPLNLRRLYGHSYKVKSEPSPHVVCHFGSIVAFQDDQLMAIADDPKIIKRLSKSPYCVAEYDDDSFSFDVDSFDCIAEIMRPVRRD